MIEYVRERAALGAKFHRIDWNALTNLPASPAVCRRRMALLNSSIQFRKAVLKLCNILAERYAKHLSKLQNKSVLDGEHRAMVRNNASAGYNSGKDYDGLRQSREINPEDQWDDFNNKDVKIAFDEALRHKRTAKLDVHREMHSVSDEFSNLREDGEQNVCLCFLPEVLEFVVNYYKNEFDSLANLIPGVIMDLLEHMIFRLT